MSAAALMMRRGHGRFRVFGERALRSWSSMVTEAQAQAQPISSTTRVEGGKIPSLMVSCTSASSRESRCMYNLTKDEKYNIINLERDRDLTLPGISTDDYRLAGSSRGFLFFSPASGAGHIRAIDPLTGTDFNLPPLAPDPDDHKMCFPDDIRIILSPSLDKAVLLRRSRSRAGRRTSEITHLPSSSSSHWTPFHEHSRISNIIDGIRDCAFHKNRLYVVQPSNKLYIAAYDEDSLESWPPSRKLKPSATWTYDDVPLSSDTIHSVHFVESPDREDIFLVFRLAHCVHPLYLATLRWLVYRLDDDGEDWDPIRSIGDSALFMGEYGGMFVPAVRDGSDTSCLLQPDSVYFTDLPLSDRAPPRGLVDTGIFDLEDGFVEFLPFTDGGTLLRHSPPVWLPPAA